MPKHSLEFLCAKSLGCALRKKRLLDLHSGVSYTVLVPKRNGTASTAYIKQDVFKQKHTPIWFCTEQFTKPL